MTTTQQVALHMMDEANVGALLIPGHGWVFPQHVRDSVAVAQAVVARLNELAR